MLNSVAGLREWFSQTNERGVPNRIPVMVNMASSALNLSKSGRSLNQSVKFESIVSDEVPFLKSTPKSRSLERVRFMSHGRDPPLLEDLKGESLCALLRCDTLRVGIQEQESY